MSVESLILQGFLVVTNTTIGFHDMPEIDWTSVLTFTLVGKNPDERTREFVVVFARSVLHCLTSDYGVLCSSMGPIQSSRVAGVATGRTCILRFNASFRLLISSRSWLECAHSAAKERLRCSFSSLRRAFSITNCPIAS